LKTEADYHHALEEISKYFEQEPELGTPEADRFELLARMIDEYEREHWPIDLPADETGREALERFAHDGIAAIERGDFTIVHGTQGSRQLVERWNAKAAGRGQPDIGTRGPRRR
jgi:hypothetical protein